MKDTLELVGRRGTQSGDPSVPVQPVLHPHPEHYGWDTVSPPGPVPLPARWVARQPTRPCLGSEGHRDETSHRDRGVDPRRSRGRGGAASSDRQGRSELQTLLTEAGLGGPVLRAHVSTFLLLFFGVEVPFGPVGVSVATTNPTCTSLGRRLLRYGRPRNLLRKCPGSYLPFGPPSWVGARGPGGSTYLWDRQSLMEQCLSTTTTLQTKTVELPDPTDPTTTGPPPVPRPTPTRTSGESTDTPTQSRQVTRTPRNPSVPTPVDTTRLQSEEGSTQDQCNPDHRVQGLRVGRGRGPSGNRGRLQGRDGPLCHWRGQSHSSPPLGPSPGREAVGVAGRQGSTWG